MVLTVQPFYDVRSVHNLTDAVWELEEGGAASFGAL